jgi:STE24 endopeptidase
MEEPRRYETIKNLVGVSGFILDVGLLAFLLISGWSFAVRDFAVSVGGSSWAAVLVYILIVGGLMKLAHLPLSFYSGFVLEHRFGLSRQTFRAWLSDQFKGLLVGVPLAIAGVELIYYLFRAYPAQWWIYAATLIVGFFVILTNLAPVLLLPIFFKFRPVENEDLGRRMERLARRTQTRICGIFEWSLGEKTRKANAAVVGWGNTRRIIVSDTLLQNFSGEEIEVIMAHEICHHVKNHIWKGMALQAGLTIVSFYLMYLVLPPLSGRFGLRDISDVAGFPLFALVSMALSLLMLPIVNYFSRRLEIAADVFALDLTGDPFAFVSSMEKLAGLNLADASPNKIIEFIFHSHPSIEERIKLAADRVGQSV